MSTTSNILISETVVNEKIKFTVSEGLIYESFDDKIKFSREEGPYKVTFTLDLPVPSIITVIFFFIFPFF